MTADASRIAECRRLISEVIAGRMTPGSHRAAFADDVVYFAVRELEEHDPAWLLAEVRDRRHPLTGRRNAVLCTARYQAELWGELRAEDPTLPPYPFSS